MSTEGTATIAFGRFSSISFASARAFFPAT